MIKQYLIDHHAIGKDNAIPTRDITNDLSISKRALVATVSKERTNGALICSKTNGDGGYYMPASREEVEEQHKVLEHGIKMRALALRPFRKALKEYRKEGGGPLNGK